MDDPRSVVLTDRCPTELISEMTVLATRPVVSHLVTNGHFNEGRRAPIEPFVAGVLVEKWQRTLDFTCVLDLLTHDDD